jgi:hypothetical protein
MRAVFDLAMPTEDDQTGQYRLKCGIKDKLGRPTPQHQTSLVADSSFANKCGPWFLYISYPC